MLYAFCATSKARHLVVPYKPNLPPPPAVAVPAPYAGPAVAHSLGLPEAATYALPPVRAVAEAPIVEQVIFCS